MLVGTNEWVLHKLHYNQWNFRHLDKINHLIKEAGSLLMEDPWRCSVRPKELSSKF